jgi:hypothetical protein
LVRFDVNCNWKGQSDRIHPSGQTISSFPHIKGIKLLVIWKKKKIHGFGWIGEFGNRASEG